MTDVLRYECSRGLSAFLGLVLLYLYLNANSASFSVVSHVLSNVDDECLGALTRTTAIGLKLRSFDGAFANLMLPSASCQTRECNAQLQAPCYQNSAFLTDTGRTMVDLVSQYLQSTRTDYGVRRGYVGQPSVSFHPLMLCDDLWGFLMQ